MKYDFSLVDAFGIEVGLKYLNKDRFQSNFGSFISILIAGLLSYQIIVVGADLVLKQNPEIIVSEKYASSPKRFTLNKNSFNLAFGIQFPQNYTHFIDNQIYTVEVRQEIMTKEYQQSSEQYIQNWEYKPIDIKPCKPSNFEVKETINYFKKLAGIDHMYCIDQDSFEPFIEGDFDQDIFSYLRIKFRLCKGDSYCRSSQEVKEALTNAFIAVNSNDVIVDPTNQSPFQTIGKNLFWKASPITAKDVSMYMRNIYSTSDEGIFFESEIYQNRTSHSFQTESIAFDETDYFFQVDIRLEKGKESFYKRSYQKIYNVLVKIGGMAKALMIIGSIFCIPVNKLHFFRLISNNLFAFSNKPNHKTKSANLNQIQSVNDKSDNFDIFSKSCYDGEINQFNMNEKFASNSRLPLSPQVNDQIEQPLPKTLLLNLPSLNKLESSSILASTASPLVRLQRENNFKNHTLFQISCSENKIYSQDKQFKQFIQSNENGNFLKVENQIEDNDNLVKLQQLKFQFSERSHQQKKTRKMENEQSKKMTAVKQSTKIPIKQKQSRQESISRIQTIFQSSENQNEKNMKESIQLRWYDYLKFYLWPFGIFQKKKKQLLYSIERIYQHLDIINIVQKLLEIEKIKQLLLNEDQINLIQFFPKPSLDIDEIEKQSSLKKQNDSAKKVSLLNDPSKLTDKDKAQQAFEALKNILKKEKLSDLDKKIIQMLDKSLFDNIEYHLEYLQDLEELEGKQPNIIRIQDFKNDSNNDISSINIRQRNINNINNEINIGSPSNLIRDNNQINEDSNEMNEINNQINEDNNQNHDHKNSKIYQSNNSLNFESMKINGELENNYSIFNQELQLMNQFPTIPLFKAHVMH